jgi:signal transduction histidine kinase
MQPAPGRALRALLAWALIANAAEPMASALAARSPLPDMGRVPVLPAPVCAAALPLAKVPSANWRQGGESGAAWMGVLMFLGVMLLAVGLLARSWKPETDSSSPPLSSPPDVAGTRRSNAWAELESLRQTLAEQQRQLAGIQEELAAARKLAQDAEAARRDTLAQISREIRTPMAAIRGYAQMIGGGCLGDCEHGGGVVREAVAGIDSNARQLLRLVDDQLREEPA